MRSNLKLLLAKQDAESEYSFGITEIGPRLDLQLFKISEGFVNKAGTVIYHREMTESTASQLKRKHFEENKTIRAKRIRIVERKEPEDTTDKLIKEDNQKYSDEAEKTTANAKANEDIVKLNKKRVQIQRKLNLKRKRN